MIKDWPSFLDLTQDQNETYEMLKKHCIKNKFGCPDKALIIDGILYLFWSVSRKDGWQETRISVSGNGYIDFQNTVEVQHGMHKKSHLENFNLALKTRFANG